MELLPTWTSRDGRDERWVGGGGQATGIVSYDTRHQGRGGSRRRAARSRRTSRRTSGPRPVVDWGIDHRGLDRRTLKTGPRAPAPWRGRKPPILCRAPRIAGPQAGSTP